MCYEEDRVYETKDYSLFVQSPDNRKQHEKKNKALEEMLCAKGWLPSHPASVYLRDDGKLVIQDGQHRYHIAVKYGLSIRFVVDEKYDIAILNNTGRAWTLEEHVQKFADKGIADYVKVVCFMKEYEIPAKQTLSLLSGIRKLTGPDIKNIVRKGKFKIRADMLSAKSIAEMYKQIRALGKLKKSPCLLEVCRKVFALSQFDLDRFYKQLEKYPNFFESRRDETFYVKTIARTYNQRHTEKGKLDIVRLVTLAELDGHEKCK